VQIVAEQARGRVPVVAGAGSNDTKKAIALSKAMHGAGATHLLHTSPMYNKPPQRGIVAHYKAIADAVKLPIVVYNVPGRTGSNIEAKTMLELAGVPGIVAAKEASGQLSQIADIIKGRSATFSVLSGDDELTLPVMALGGDGIISVISNATPRLMAQLCNQMAAGDLAGARELHFKLLPWMRAAFVESNPLPVKAALSMMGRIRNVLRLPLVPLTEANAGTVRAALVAAGALT
jgi:4-hydroxy-tetrahydrodipicolinate synthase